MLFALRWIQNMANAVQDFFLHILEDASLLHYADLLTSGTLLLIGIILLGLLYCVFGYRYDRLIFGILGGILGGMLGWDWGRAMNPNHISVAITYALLMVIVGFLILFWLYYIGILSGAFLIGSAVLQLVIGAARPNLTLFLALVFAILYLSAYLRIKPIMAALTGATVLALTALKLSLFLSLSVIGFTLAITIPLEFYLRRRHYDRVDAADKAEREKYPYGPGLVYGWKEPERKRSKRR